ncbi:MAG: putative tail tubular protein [Prokaryotic dsDNA virus sp.]|nr:MAG: putative tail tubular protein [Prokaryotic dsDNA virus sp.]|tara:strand:- start:35936 stop:38308 length:2373 start_codon:yes stop_codon:yes gene_type:complete
MRIEDSYPTPVLGVSTLPPRNRLQGQAGLQKNFRSDPIQRLTRRPSLAYTGSSLLVDGIAAADVFHHSYERDGSTYTIIVDKSNGAMYGFVDNQAVTMGGDLSASFGPNLVAQTIDHKTYILNKDTVVKMLPVTDENTIERVSHMNVTTALAYGETVKVTLIESNGTRTTYSFSVPDLYDPANPNDPPDYDTADKARATANVAEKFAGFINAKVGIEARSLGSTVSVWEVGRANWVELEVETGQGDKSIVVFNQTVENIEGIPKYAVVGTRIKVRPNPTSDKGTYYLQAERTADSASGEDMEEVVWAENRNPEQEYSVDTLTLPRVCEFTGSSFTMKLPDWKERQAGDDDSVPRPKFVGKTITDVGYFQKRLVFLTENYAVMSETDDELNFWRQSAAKLLVSDRVEVSSSAVGIDKLQFILPHNRDLLFIASNGQFKIDGSRGVTPETISMALTTKYECQTTVAPTTMGNSVFFPIDYGASTGLQEYTGEKDTGQDFAAPLTQHIVGYMQGKAKMLTSSPNLEMLAMTTENAARNQIFVYEQYTDTTGKRRNQAWSEWTFAGDGEIVDLQFKNDKLSVLMVEGSKLYSKPISMYTRATTGLEEIYLDDLYQTTTTGDNVTVPVGYPLDENTICVRGDGTQNELFKVGFTISGRTLTFDENIGVGLVYVGRPFESRYQPTRPFKYDENGVAITTDRIRVGRYILNLSDTNEIKMHIKSDYYDYPDQVFNSRFVGGLQNTLGSVPYFTGDHKFSFSQDARLADVEFYCDNWLGCTISGISWEGQYFQSKGRM